MTVSTNERSSLKLEVSSRELVSHWKRCGQLADLVASYLAEDFDPTERAIVKNVLSTVVNELVENAAKFSADDQAPLRIVARRRGDVVCVESWNAASETSARSLKKTLDELQHVSPDELFKRRAAESSRKNTPGVGLLIVKRDYGARIHAIVTPRADALLNVHIVLELPASGITGP